MSGATTPGSAGTRRQAVAEALAQAARDYAAAVDEELGIMVLQKTFNARQRLDALLTEWEAA